MNKKAMSPLAATLVLIVLAVGLGVLIMSLSRGYIEDKAVDFEEGYSPATYAIDPSLKHVEIAKQPVEFEETTNGVNIVLRYSEDITSKTQRIEIVGDRGTQEILVPETAVKEGVVSVAVPYDKEKVGNVVSINVK